VTREPAEPENPWASRLFLSFLIIIESDSDIEILNQEPSIPVDNVEQNDDELIALKLLEPDVEYHQNLTSIFVNLDEYARVFHNPSLL